ncbi:hypothetical protein [Rhodococcus sp. 105337]|uniref:hypothetical protein n=1 Tax=Rhodococcus sp. 105337 TaxID=2725310 RepID=UPI001F0E3A2A|nr:hypothetical protein [Rhodococcus sp. 105337]
MSRRTRASTMLVAVAVAGALSACSSDDAPTVDGARSSASEAATNVQEQAGGVLSSVQQAASDAADKAGEAFDDAKMSAFVAAFRAGYPQLSADRETSSIESVVTETCPLIEDGAGDQEVNDTVGELAADGTSVPDDEQAARIAQLVRVACG